MEMHRAEQIGQRTPSIDHEVNQPLAAIVGQRPGLPALSPS
jgi:C4-dicarboxylate-specific signal transduction histidine kinase